MSNSAPASGRVSAPAPNIEPLAHTIKQTCLLMQVSRSHLYEQIAAGRVRTVQIGNRRLVPRSEINRLLGEVA